MIKFEKKEKKDFIKKNFYFLNIFILSFYFSILINISHILIIKS